MVFGGGLVASEEDETTDVGRILGPACWPKERRGGVPVAIGLMRNVMYVNA